MKHQSKTHHGRFRNLFIFAKTTDVNVNFILLFIACNKFHV